MPASEQPPPFGCRYLAIAVVASLLFGLGGGFLGASLSDRPSGNNQPTTGNQLINSENASVVRAVDRVSPAVVSISLTSQVQTFLGPASEKSGGTGFIVTSDGLIATNKHVVEGVRGTLTVLTNDGKTFQGQVKAVDPTLDFALIKIEAKNLPVVALGNSDSLQVGQEVVAIGNALGEFQNTVTAGVISAKERTIVAGDSSGTSSEQLENLLQTDAAINPGNSGGPLINLAGEVIGVNTATAGEAQSIGFAIPINSARGAIDSFTARGKIIRASLGVRFITLTPESAKLNNLPTENGALLSGSRGAPPVVPGSAAERAGLRDGDIITAVNETKLDENHTLPAVINKFSPGDEVEVTFRRGSQEQKVRIKLDERQS